MARDSGAQAIATGKTLTLRIKIEVRERTL